MYESPIEKIVGYVQSQLVESEESELMAQITQTIGYHIDRDELIRALQYDRQQYEKGYADGVADTKPRWIPVSERLPEDNTKVLVTLDATYREKVLITWYQDKEHGFLCGLVTAWMPLPEPYQEEE